jgi:hypothetical protein
MNESSWHDGQQIEFSLKSILVFALTMNTWRFSIRINIIYPYILKYSLCSRMVSIRSGKMFTIFHVKKLPSQYGVVLLDCYQLKWSSPFFLKLFLRSKRGIQVCWMCIELFSEPERKRSSSLFTCVPDGVLNSTPFFPLFFLFFFLRPVQYAGGHHIIWCTRNSQTFITRTSHIKWILIHILSHDYKSTKLYINQIPFNIYFMKYNSWKYWYIKYISKPRTKKSVKFNSVNKI